MRVAIVLNGRSGTVRDAGPDRVLLTVVDVFRKAGHETVGIIREGGRTLAAVGEAARSKSFDAVVVGGGDGTVSAAAGIAVETQTPLGVLPLGTMNLFARALGGSLDMTRSAEELATGEIRRIDAAEVNGTVFIHHASFGMHPKMIRLRERLGYGSRFGKIWANFQAFRLVARKPPRLKGTLEIDDVARPVDTATLLVTNNVWGEGHLPYADRLDAGILGVNLARSSEWADMLEMSASMALGSLENNHLLERATGRTVVFQCRKLELRASIDGEVVKLRPPVRCRILAGRLPVLAPRLPD